MVEDLVKFVVCLIFDAPLAVDINNMLTFDVCSNDGSFDVYSNTMSCHSDLESNAKCIA